MLTKLFGANWKTTWSMIGATLMAALTWLSSLSYDQGPIAMVIPIEWKPWVTKIAGIATLILFAYNGIRQKDKAVTGGHIQQTVSGAVAEPGTQSLVDETVRASIRSGDDAVTPAQRAAVRNNPT
jgi:hypothetical protein